MATRTVMLLGRGIWTRCGDVWHRESLDEGNGLALPAVARLADLLSQSSTDKTIVVFEPSGMSHQSVETPRVSRPVFASLARVRHEHPVVESEGLGWGMEYPEPTPGGVYMTLMHSEMTPGVACLRDACTRAGSTLSAVWPAYTAAFASVKSRSPSSKVRFVLILVPGFVAVAFCGGGKRSFKAWGDPMSERDWKALAALIGEVDARPSLSMAETELRRGGIAVVAEGDVGNLCPIWDEISRSGRVESIVKLEAFAASAAQIPLGHPANLVETFPTPRCMDRQVASLGVVGLLAAVALGLAMMGERRQFMVDAAASSSRMSALVASLATLDRNLAEMNRLRNEAPDGQGMPEARKHEALLALSEAVPDTLTLTSFVMNGNGKFDLEAIIVGNGFDPVGARRALERSGFKPSARNGWVHDAASGKLLVDGIYEEPRG